MAITKLDISLAARAAGHLYLTTSFFGNEVHALEFLAQDREDGTPRPFRPL
jgi:hypothetical protein